MKSLRCFAIVLTVFPLSTHPAIAEKPTDRSTFPAAGLLPKQEIGVSALRAETPHADGRGIVVAIFDTGVDPGAEGLQKTSTGDPKIIDLIDGTGAGDVVMTAVGAIENNQLTGLSGRTLKIDPAWKQNKRPIYLGMKAAADFFPDSLIRRLKANRRDELRRQSEKWEIKLRSAIAKMKASKSAGKEKNKQQIKELEARLSQLAVSMKSVKDVGPIYDCLVFHDGKTWRAVVDTNENGDLTDERPLTNFAAERRYATFRNDAELNFGVNIYDNGKLLSIVSDSSPHGTHVAGIVAANYANDFDRSGVAPGAQIVSVKIGDSRLGGMETGRAIERGLAAVARHRCHVVNMSFSEPMRWSQSGRIIQRIEETVLNRGVVYVASAGNDGPGLRTITAPGGASDHIIGVGAYVSPAMMTASYGIDSKKKPAGLFTWSSRGPAGDGGTGVTLVAPGAAEASVPRWTADRSMQMNGTSMASPSAAGGIAVLLSALKQANVKWSPNTIRRGLEATATPLKNYLPVEAGAGLMQVDRAFHLLKEAGNAFADQPLLQVSFQNRAMSRGVLLNQPWELEQPTTVRAKIAPIFRENENAQKRGRFSQQLKLTCDQDWVTCGENLFLSGNGRNVTLQIDPTRLPPGVAYAQVVATVAGESTLPPLFRIPITVIKPEKMKSAFENEWKLSLTPGESVRKAVRVPPGCQWMIATATPNDKSLDRVSCSIDVGRESDQRVSRTRNRFSLRPDKPWTRRYSVTPGSIVEMTIAQDWQGRETRRADFKVTFDGWGEASTRVSGTTDGGYQTLTVAAVNAPRSLAPRARLTKFRTLTAPASFTIESSADPRERIPGASSPFQLEATYELSQQRDSSVLLSLPNHGEMLYESPTSGLELKIINERGRIVAHEDFTSQAITLPQGEYRVKLLMRSDQSQALESFKNALLAIERPLKSAVSLRISNSHTDAVAGKSFSSRSLVRGESASVVVQTPHALPPDVQPGDLLIGDIKFSDESSFDSTAAVSIVAARSTKPATTGANKDPKPGRFASIDRNDLAQFQRTWKKLSDADRASLALLQQRLHWLDDTAHRKQRLADVIAAADDVIQSIDQDELALHFGRRPTGEQVKNRAEMMRRKAILVDALYRKGRALGYMELPDVLEKFPIKDPADHDQQFESNFAALSQWVDPTEKDWVLLTIRRDRRKNRWGAALKLLNEQISQSEPTYWYHKKRRDVFEQLGWSRLFELENNVLAVEFPKKTAESASTLK